MEAYIANPWNVFLVKSSSSMTQNSFSEISYKLEDMVGSLKPSILDLIVYFIIKNIGTCGFDLMEYLETWEKIFDLIYEESSIHASHPHKKRKLFEKDNKID